MAQGHTTMVGDSASSGLKIIIRRRAKSVSAVEKQVINEKVLHTLGTDKTYEKTVNRVGLVSHHDSMIMHEAGGEHDE